MRAAGLEGVTRRWGAAVPAAVPTILIHDLQIRVIHAATGEALRQLTLDPTRHYQPTGQPPGRKAKTPNQMSVQAMPMSRDITIPIYSSGCRAIETGSRPARSHPATVATHGRPSATMAR